MNPADMLPLSIDLSGLQTHHELLAGFGEKPITLDLEFGQNPDKSLEHFGCARDEGLHDLPCLVDILSGSPRLRPPLKVLKRLDHVSQ
jgi:hypothetical protein